MLRVEAAEEVAVQSNEIALIIGRQCVGERGEKHTVLSRMGRPFYCP